MESNKYTIVVVFISGIAYGAMQYIYATQYLVENLVSATIQIIILSHRLEMNL